MSSPPKKGNHTIASAFAFAASHEADFAGAVGAFDYVSGGGVGGQVVDDLFAFFLVHSSIFNTNRRKG